MSRKEQQEGNRQRQPHLYYATWPRHANFRQAIPLPPWKRSGLLLSLLIPCSRCKSSAFVHTATFPFAKRKIPRGLWGRRGGDDDDERNDGRKLSTGKKYSTEENKRNGVRARVYARRLYEHLWIFRSGS